MGISRILLDDAPEYVRKCWRIDSAAVYEVEAEIEHVYGRVEGVRRRRRFFPRRLQVLTPVKDAGETFLPEAVEEQYFASDVILSREDGEGPQNTTDRSLRSFASLRMTVGTIGAFVRPSVAEMIDRTRARVARTRDDVVWHLFDRAPSPDDLLEVEIWIDPAVDEDDFDGFVAEALAMGRVVVASRTALNAQRLEKGRTGFLVPPRDPNELTHAILTALFKPELARPRTEAARQTISKFRPRQRERALKLLYEQLRS